MNHREIVVIRYRKSLRIGAIDEATRDKVRVTCDKSRTFLTPRENVLLETGVTASTQGEIDRFVRDVEARAQEIDLGEVWELTVDDDASYGFRELAELWSSEPLDSPTLAAFLWHLDSDRCAHFRAEGDTYHPATRDEVAADHEKSLRQAQEKEEDTAFLEWLAGHREDADASALTVRQRAWLDRIREFVIVGDEWSQAGRVKTFVTSLPGVGGNPRRALFKKLVERGIFEPHEHLDLLRLDVPIAFGPGVEDAAAAAGSAALDVDERVDFRADPTISIDDETTTDIDDAVSVAPLPDGGYRVAIHITDLSVVVPRGSRLDEAAAHRVVTHYFPDRKIPMLPPALSDRSASLVEGAERAVISLEIELDASLGSRSTRFVRGIARSDRRMTYDEVDAILADAHGTHPERDSIEDALTVLRRFSAHLYAGRMAAGAAEIQRSDVDVRVDDDGTIRVIPRSAESAAQTIVSELMILYNVEAARLAAEAGIPLIYRHQGAPSADPDIARSVHPALWRYLALKSTPPPDLRLDPGAHRMLGVEPYCQATSPIRRYVDLVEQRQIAAHLARREPPHDGASMSRVLYETEERLREFRRLEADRRRYWILEHLRRERKSDVFEGVVLEATDSHGQVEVLDLSLRAGVALHSPVTPGDVLRLTISHVDPWEGLVRFRMAD